MILLPDVTAKLYLAWGRSDFDTWVSGLLLRCEAFPVFAAPLSTHLVKLGSSYSAREVCASVRLFRHDEDRTDSEET